LFGFCEKPRKGGRSDWNKIKIYMKITGHNTISMFERYNTVDRDGAHEAIKRLDDYLTKPHCGVKSLDYYFKALDMKSSDPITP
jgi:hypothetical protein